MSPFDLIACFEKLVRIRPFSQKNHENVENEPVSSRNAPLFPVITPRAPVALDPGRPSLTDLPDDIVMHILNLIQESCPDDLLKMATLSSALYHKARYTQHHTVRINLNKSTQARNRLKIIALYGQKLLFAIRTLEIRGRYHQGEQQQLRKQESDEILVILTGMFPAMTGLRDLHWRVEQIGTTLASMPIPSSILTQLGPRARLHTIAKCSASSHDSEIPDHALTRQFLSGLAHNQNLFSLEVLVYFLHESECLPTMQALKKVLLTCPNLVRIPDIDVWWPSWPPHGVVDGPSAGAPYPGLGLSGREKPPALEEFGICRYPWGRRSSGNFWSYHSAGYPEDAMEREVDYWAETFDWSRLRRLNECDGELVLKIAPKLANLEELVCSLQYWIDKAAFLDALPTGSLRRLSLATWSQVNDEAAPVIRHGDTLRELEIHRNIASNDPISNMEMQLEKLSVGLPQLERLKLDVDRDQADGSSDWPYGTLDIIARFPRIQTITLWFPLRNGRTPALMGPALNVFTARELFCYLRKRNTTNSLRRLELYSGRPGAPEPSLHRIYFGDEPSWGTQNSMSFVCEETHTPGGNAVADEDRVVVTCPHLRQELQTELVRLANIKREERVGLELFEMDVAKLAVKVALDGPLTTEEWLAWRRLRADKRSHHEDASFLRRMAASFRT